VSQRFPVCTAKDVVRVLRQHGFAKVSQIHFLILTFSFSLLTFPIVPGNKKAAEAFLRPAAF
jgi:hypothetical protein